MDKYSINYTNLQGDLNRPKVYKYADVKDRLVKVAWDVVKFDCDSEDIDGLWQIQATDDGEVIVAKYDDGGLSAESQKEEIMTANASWDVIPSNDKSMNIFYKGDAVRKIASADIGVSEGDLNSFCKDIASKLNTNVKFAKSLIKDVPNDRKSALLSKYPELTK